MAQHVVVMGAGGRVGQTHPSRIRRNKGYAKSRQDYDRRRRRSPLDAQGVAYKQLLQGDPCVACGRRAAPGEERNAADHIVPLAAGGLNVWDNLAAICRRCNASKKNKPLLAWMLERKERAHGQ